MTEHERYVIVYKNPPHMKGLDQYLAGWNEAEEKPVLVSELNNAYTTDLEMAVSIAKRFPTPGNGNLPAQIYKLDTTPRLGQPV